MNLSSATVRAYRSIADVTITFERDITIFIGENNIGKSNVLDALYAGLRVNRLVRQGAFELTDFHLAKPTALPGEAGPIEIIVGFKEDPATPWSVDIIAAFPTVLSVDGASGARAISVRVESMAPSRGAETSYDWAFLDDAGNKRPGHSYAELQRLQALRPLFRLFSLRDSQREFSKRSTYFGPFVNDPVFSEDIKQDLLDALSEINRTVVDSHEAFGVLQTNLDRGTRISAGQPEQTAVIEAVPSRLSDLLSNTQISFVGRTGAILPLDRQGSGTQSLSVISLFRAYVESKLKTQYDDLSEPLLLIEEPEAHLHPCGVRTLWQLLQSLPGQKVVTSHSGDLLSEAPLRAVRRLYESNGQIIAGRIDESTFNANELHHLTMAIRRYRAELLFANSWILVEGDTESASLPLFGDAIGLDFNSRGFRVVEYSQHSGPAVFAKAADQLGIRWHCIVDGDGDGAGYKRQLETYLGSPATAAQCTTLDQANFEAYLWSQGFDAIYRPKISAQKANTIIAAVGTDEYYTQSAKALSRGAKVIAAIEAADAVRMGVIPIPPLIDFALKAL